MKPLYTKKNGTSQRVAAIEVKMPASYPASRITRESVSVTADGVKTLSTLLDEIHALIDATKLSEGSYAEIRVTNSQHTIFRYEYADNSFNIYCSMSLVTTGAEINTIVIKSTGSTRKSAIGSSVTDESSRVFPSGTTVTFNY